MSTKYPSTMSRIFLLMFLFLSSTPLKAQNSALAPMAQKIAKALGARSSYTQGKLVRLDYFTLENTEMGSVFSRELYRLLRAELPNAGVQLRENGNDLAKQQAFLGKDDYVVCGIYKENGGKIEVQTYLYDLRDKRPIRFIQEDISTDLLAAQKIPWRPNQLEQAKRTRNLIVEDEAPAPNPKPSPAPLPTPEPSPSRGDFALSVMTSKGFGHQVFTEGERMRIAVKAEKPCFLRLIYHAADGNKVLLLENVPMTVSDEGNFVTVPQEFECSAPFGVETLQLFACTEVFPPLKTHAQDGFIFIDEAVEGVNAQTRGFKPVSSGKKDSKSTFSKAEVSVQVTTLAK